MGTWRLKASPQLSLKKLKKKLSLDGLRTISFLYYYVAQNASKHVKNDSDSWDLQKESKSQLVDPEFVKWNRETCWTLAAFQPPKRPPCKCQGAANGDTTATQEGLVAKTHVVQLILRLTHHGHHRQLWQAICKTNWWFQPIWKLLLNLDHLLK